MLPQTEYAGILRKDRGQKGRNRRVEPRNIQGVAVERCMQSEYRVPRPDYQAREQERISYSETYGCITGTVGNCQPLARTGRRLIDGYIPPDSFFKACSDSSVSCYNVILHIPLYRREHYSSFCPGNRRRFVFTYKDTADERAPSTAIAT